MAFTTAWSEAVHRTRSSSMSWCPSENRWFANRVQNNVPIFAIDSSLKLGRVNRDSAQCAHLEPPATH